MNNSPQTFESFLDNLLPEQREAVDTVYGPVMIIAGPGTGKTRILSLRIGQIRLLTGAEPENILCLTYTEAAAAEMRDRLIQLYGATAYQFHVHTFHGFCNMVIQEHPEYFSQAKELEAISKLDKFKLLKELIDSFPYDHPLKKEKGQKYYYWVKLDALFELMKKENWTPAFMHEKIDQYMEDKKSDFLYVKGDKKGELKPDYFTKVVDRMELLKHGVDAFIDFNALLQSQGKYTFEDMLQWVIKAFDEQPALLLDYQEKFQYILVDEFQDTNGAQLAILNRLLRHDFVDQPNVFVVGDDDQSIYRFQGASLSNMKGFVEEYEPVTIPFFKNHRSTQRILDAAVSIMSPVKGSLKRTYTDFTELEAKSAWASEDTRVQLMEFPTEEYENAFIFSQLKEWHEKKTEGSVAVLFKQHAQSAGLTQALQGAGIPFTIQKQINVLEIPFIKDLLKTLKVIESTRDVVTVDDSLLYQVLHLPYLKINPRDLQLVVLGYTGLERSERENLFLFMSQSGWVEASAIQQKETLQKAIEGIIEGGRLSYSATLPHILEWTVHHFGFMEWMLAQPDRLTLMTALKTLYTFVEKETRANKGMDIRQLLNVINDMKDYNIELTIQPLTNPSESGIILASLHGSKGLEFDHVYIKTVTEKQWEKKQDPNTQFSYPDNLVTGKSEEKENKIDDLRRLLFVGMTRARRRLWVTWFDRDNSDKSHVHSSLLMPLMENSGLYEFSKPEVDEVVITNYLQSFFKGNLTPELHLNETEIQDRIKNFILNPSALNDYLECPLRFYYAKILTVPSFQTSTLRLGSALHKGLELYFKRRFHEKIEDTGLDRLLSAFEYAMRKEENFFTPGEYDGLINFGRKILTDFYNQEHSNWRSDVTYFLEYTIKNIQIDGVPVKGFIDRLDKEEDKLIVTDYKSGRSTSLSAKIKGPDDKEPLGGSYWRQIVFYDLMLRVDPQFRKSADTYYVQALEPDAKGNFPKRHIPVSEPDRDFVRNLITETYAKIQAQEFHKACGKCDWCLMHNITSPSMDPEEAE